MSEVRSAAHHPNSPSQVQQLKPDECMSISRGLGQGNASLCMRGSCFQAESWGAE